MTVEVQIEGQDFIALNGGPQFKFTVAISFSVDCKTQEEVDRLWQKLTDGGEEGACGWLKPGNPSSCESHFFLSQSSYWTTGFPSR
ncbi:MAG TPA: VOC family protein [Candidatus Bathyarchaeia archaeon]|nr:VOC family protein [Candidatus Bathyarchaeia archaeon]